MKLLINLIVIFFICSAGLSCQKEFLCPDCDINKPPVAVAGIDHVLLLPTDSLILNGKRSFDPDGKIISYKWTAISGPFTFNIINPTDSITKVNRLVKGIYKFELQVKDNGGLLSKDTVQITVNETVSTNILPEAVAGNDTIIYTNQLLCSGVTLNVTLKGHTSFDVDGSIISYLWTGKGNILTPTSPITQVSDLLAGNNMFTLRVTDNHGGIGLDTIFVEVRSMSSRPVIPVGLISVGKLSQTRSDISAAAVGTKIIFAGGRLDPANNFPSSSRVDIYDIVTNVWSTAELSKGRFGMGVAVSESKIFFAGGGVQQNNGSGLWEYTGAGSAAIDIYDAASNTWSVQQLSSARKPVGAAAGNKVLFAGGDNYNPSLRVDIYDITTGTWSISQLTEPRHISQTAVAGNKIFFAGGSAGVNPGGTGGRLSKRIDIYDAQTNTWKLDFLSKERVEMGAITAENKIYWGGGILWDPVQNNFGVTSSVEIKDLLTNTTTFDCLSEAKDGITAVRQNNKIIFFGGSFFGIFKTRFDIYDLGTGTWSIGELPQNLAQASIVTLNNEIYIAGGFENAVLSNQVWKLKF